MDQLRSLRDEVTKAQSALAQGIHVQPEGDSDDLLGFVLGARKAVEQEAQQRARDEQLKASIIQAQRDAESVKELDRIVNAEIKGVADKSVDLILTDPPFFDNIAYGLRVAGIKDKAQLDETIEKSLKGAALWEEVKDRLLQSALSLSGGQQQRLCIARALAVELLAAVPDSEEPVHEVRRPPREARGNSVANQLTPVIRNAIGAPSCVRSIVPSPPALR